MTLPQIELVPLRPAVRADAATTVDVLVRITPPEPERKLERPALNLALVLDRSGSMAAHNKIDFARAAAVFAVQQLRPDDRVSVVIFDNHVETLVPNTLAADRGRIVEAIGAIHPGNATALHDGWREGGTQVGSHLVAGGLNRVLLLSDGLANVGETRPDAIANDVHRLAADGISTTTLGLGDDYNEDLLQAMAQSGDGNYYYIDHPDQLPAMFQSELHGLMATIGTAVSLGVEPQQDVVVTEVLNELDRTADGHWKLPNLVAGMPILVVVRLQVPPMASEWELCRFELAWTTATGSERQSVVVALALPALPGRVWESLTPNIEVQERTALLVIARLKKQATRCLEQDDLEAAQCCLRDARAVLAAAPPTPEMQREHQALAQIEAFMESGAWMRFTKTAKFQSYQRHSSKPYP